MALPFGGPDVHPSAEEVSLVPSAVDAGEPEHAEPVAGRNPGAAAVAVPSRPTPSPASTPAATPAASASAPAGAGTATPQTGSSTSSGTATPTSGASTPASTGTPSAPATTVSAPAAGATGSTAAFASVQEFTTPVAPGKWPSNGSAPAAYPNYVSYGDGTSGTYYPSKVMSVHDGVLDWHCQNSQGAAVLPFGYSGFLYGTYTVRMRTDDFRGYHVAFLLWPNTDKWTHEIDGPENETSSSKPYPAVLQSTSPSAVFAPAAKPAMPASWHDAEFHNYTWQWAPGSLTFYQDGTKITTVTGNVPAQKMHPVLQVGFANALGGQKPDPSLSGHVYVDRVMYDPSTTIAPPTN